MQTEIATRFLKPLYYCVKYYFNKQNKDDEVKP